MVRQGQLLAVMLTVLVALLPPSPAYGNSKAGDKAGPSYVPVKAGTPVTVLGLYRDPANSGCIPPNAPPCRPHTYAITQLPNGKVVFLPYKDVNYQTQTVLVDGGGPGPLTAKWANRYLGLPDTGGAALLPLLGAVMLIGGGLILRRLLH